MKKVDVLAVLNKDMLDGNGEIIEETENYIRYFEYSTDMETKYRFEERISDEIVKQLIHVGDSASKYGLTKDHIIAVLKKVFGDDYPDAVCTLSGIIIPSNENEFYEMLDKSNGVSDDMREWYDWENEEEFVGHMFSAHQIALVNECKIASTTKEMCGVGHLYNDEYQIGIMTTLIHEMRHLMLETNVFLPEDEFPESEKEEDSVEEFCRLKYETLGNLRFWK